MKAPDPAPFAAGAPVLVDGVRGAVYVAPETRTLSRVILAGDPAGTFGVLRTDRLSPAPAPRLHQIIARDLGYDLPSRTRELVRQNLEVEVAALQPTQGELPL